MSELEPTRIGVEVAQALLAELSSRMCGGEPLDDYIEDIRAQGQSQCTNVWSKGIIAYRCRTCQMNDSSAICVDCFQNGNHWEHDYVMYHSESGGCCDCGDRAAWKELGFCTAHRCLDILEAKVKEELLEPTHIAVQYVLGELLVWVKKLNDKLSDQEGSTEQETDMEVAMAMVYLEWSQKVCAVDALRNVFCKDMINYEILHQTDTSVSSLDILFDCLGWMPERLIEAETTLFLQLLYKNEFKDQFLDRLKGKYEKMIILAIGSEAYMKNYKHLDTNLDRVMVQLFNDPEMTTCLIHKYNLLELFIGVFSKVVASAVNEGTAVVDVEHKAIKCKVYLRPQGDLRLIVSHGDIAIHLLTEQPQLFPNILEVLVKLQWMNAYYCEDEDIEFENSWTLAIQLEMNSMAIIFQLISRCYQDPSVGKKTLVTAATYTLKALKQYVIQAKLIVERDDSADNTVSLHIPLHRTFSAILQKLVLLPWDNEERGFLSGLKDKDDFKFTEDEILCLMDHPLRISVWMAQIRAQMWRKTSEEFSRLELIYRGSFWHDQSMDMDILLLQFCTIAFENLQAKVFIKIAERFNFKKEVTIRITPERNRRQAGISLLQDFIKLILLIVRERRNLGRAEGDEEQLKCFQYDVIQWLCVRDQTYSQLCRALSAVPMDHHTLNAMLDKVAIYHEPKVADRGYYQLKPEYWEQFDPLFAHFYLNELEDAEDRAVKVGKLEHYWRIRAPPAASPPYDRLSGLLHTKACHLFLLNVLDEVRFLVGEETTATAGEALGVTALQMMAVLVSDSRNNTRNAASNNQVPMESLDEFLTEDITVNILVRIRSSDGTNRSIFDMLQVLVRVNHCTRLVDSVNHVLELLCLSSSEKTRAFEVDSQGAEDMQRRLRKEQRQKAILEEFAAKRKAFMETQSDSDDDDEGFDGGSEMEASNIAHDTSGYKSSTAFTSETLAKAAAPVAEADYVAMETSSETKECVLCKRKKDEKNSSPCWIGLVQRYNFPHQVLNGGKAVANASEDGLVSNFNQIKGVESINDDLDQLVIVGRPPGSGDPSAIDFSTVQHVQCCGHQMHYDCFQDHMKTLQLSHNAGKGVVDPGKAEFLCPTCRRLANVLLPDVDASLSSKKLDMHCDGQGVEEIGNEWKRFWQSNKNLESAMDSFCCQVLRVDEQSPQAFLSSPSRFRISHALWEGLVLNVVHCELETREGYVKTETASSSSAPIKLSDECTWGGDPSHWIALRELGRLAMLSNTLPDAVQEKSQRLRMLRRSLQLPGRRENLVGSATFTESSPIRAGTSELEKIMHEIFPQMPPDLAEPSDLLDLADTFPGSSHGQSETVILVENPGSTPFSIHEEREEERACKNTASNHNREESKDDYALDSKYAVTQHIRLAAPDPIAPDPQQKFEIRFEDAKFEGQMTEGAMVEMSQLSSPEQEQSRRRSLPKEQSKDTWIMDILNNGIFTADPLWLLTLLLVVFNGQPDRRSLHSMVKFAYTIAVLQAQIAVTRLGVEGAEMESFVQRACLPFLRRAAMLVQIITREDFRGQHGLSGTKVMDFTKLQLALQLPDCTQILQPQVHGARETLATQLLHLHDPVSKSFTFELRKVPRKAQLHKLPRVFQELLLENIHNKKTCGLCGEMPADPAICLICGMLLCCGTDCCRRNGTGECSRHAAEESAGVGIFLLLRSTQLLLVRNNRTCMGLSLYLDIHGEEDLYLRRSQLLYLSDLRLNEVRRLWMTAAFDYDSYILRNSQSRPNVY